MQQTTKILIRKVTHLKTKTKTENLISFEDTSKIIAIFDYLSAHVKKESIDNNLEILSTEFGYNLLDKRGKTKYEFIIDEISD